MALYASVERRSVALQLDDSRLKKVVQLLCSIFDSGAALKLHRIEARSLQDKCDPGKTAFSLQFNEAGASNSPLGSPKCPGESLECVCGFTIVFSP
jgi:hypothetical protein